jgi:hypothetical protein
MQTLTKVDKNQRDFYTLLVQDQLSDHNLQLHHDVEE